MNKNALSFFASAGLLAAATIWGFAFVVVKDSLAFLGAFYIIALRFTIAWIAMACVFFSRLKKINARSLVHGAILGLFLFAAYAFQTVGLLYTTVGKNAFLTTFYIILIPIFAWILTKKKPDFYTLFAAIFAIAGIALLSLAGNGDTFSINIGDALTLLCSVFYALHILYTEKYNKTESALLLTILQFFFASVFAWILSPFFDGAFPAKAVQNARVIFSLLYLGIASTMIAFALQNVGLKFVRSSLASLFLSFESVFGVLFGVLLLGEAMNIRIFFGCALIFFAVILAQWK